METKEICKKLAKKIVQRKFKLISTPWVQSLTEEPEMVQVKQVWVSNEGKLFLSLKEYPGYGFQAIDLEGVPDLIEEIRKGV